MRILLVDDHAEVRASLRGLLEELGHVVAEAGDGEAALAELARARPDLVLSDLRMPVLDGLGLLARLETLDDPPPLALMTAFDDTDSAIDALRRGAVDYLRKPIDVRELNALIERLDPGRAVDAPSAGEFREEADGLVVCDQATAALLLQADRLHRITDAPVLIQGETGTGKELFARRVHHGGEPGKAGPFVAVNCAAIAPGLFEAELFGYAAGAFTGAAPKGSPGRLAAAAGGTVFLDEIADLPLDQQAKLLRVLEQKTWYPVGDERERQLQARVVCACNAELLNRVREGRFREDLYYRLKVASLRLPPLRADPARIPVLARALLARIRAGRGRGFRAISRGAAKRLQDFPWPGNVRQLRHLLEEACLLYDDEVLDAEHLDALLPAAEPATGAIRRQQGRADPGPRPAPPAALRRPRSDELPAEGLDLDDWTRALVEAALARCGGSPVRTAEYLGISRKVLYTLRKRYGLLERSEP